MASSETNAGLLEAFLQPLHVDVERCHELSQLFLQNFTHLAAESLDQFLPTPISESILRPVADHGHGRHLAIDIGGTNLRVGFVELLTDDADEKAASGSSTNGSKTNGAKANGTGINGHSTNGSESKPSAGRLQRRLEKSWPIANHLKDDNADSLFLWIGKCIAEVVQDGCRTFGLPGDKPLPLGITFSFPAEQNSLAQAMVTSMGKGFTLPPNLELGSKLQNAYEKLKGTELPPIQVAAIANDSVSTLISFIFDYDGVAHRRAAMGLILGTGSNATVPIKLSCLHPTKRPQNVSVLPGEKLEDVRIAVNTEWSINGTAPPMREMGLITSWDDELSAANEKPGFQPLEYMTAGRYLGELGRIMLLDYMTNTLKMPVTSLPAKLRERHSISTTFLSHFKPLQPATLLDSLRKEIPESEGQAGFAWTEHLAEALYRIAKAIELRAAGIIAAAILALMTLGEEIPAEGSMPQSGINELGVGYTGGCIVHFQDYLKDCQEFIDKLVQKRFGSTSPLRVAMSPCHDGGITGAGILVAAAQSSQTSRT